MKRGIFFLILMELKGLNQYQLRSKTKTKDGKKDDTNLHVFSTRTADSRS